MDRIAAAVDEYIVVHRHPPFRLQQRFARIVQKEVAVDQIAVFAARTPRRNMAQQDIGARLRAGDGVGLGKHVVPNHRVVAIRIFGRARGLMLDLQVVTQGVHDPVGFDDAADEGIRAIGIAEVHAGADPLDAVPSDHPPQYRTFGGNAHVLLRRGMVVNMQ